MNPTHDHPATARRAAASRKHRFLIVGAAVIASVTNWATGGADSTRADRHRNSIQPEAHTPDGKPLFPMQLTPERRAKLEADLAVALEAKAAAPNRVENWIWLGRRLAYLGRYRDAIAVYTTALEHWPDSYRLYRHRGHRWITVREFERAIVDLERATELIATRPDSIEPDGAPNPHGIPRSTTHSNIWYHLGLAYYLKGDFERARRCYTSCLEFCTNDDMLCATTDWLYMTLRRLGRDEEAARTLEVVHPDMEILENTSYHRRLLMYIGELEPEELLAADGASDLDLATQGYGVGNWYLVHGDTTRAKEILTRVVQGAYWPAFGFIAAEADLARMR